MTPYRVEKLREINFSWSGRKPKVWTWKRSLNRI
jgi:hypothetical protein